MLSTIQLHPEIATLHAQIHALRDELVRAVAYHDDLRHTAIPYLEAVYQQALSPAHLAAVQAQMKVQRTKRVVELALQLVNCGQPAPPIAAITAQVEHELAAWSQHIAALQALDVLRAQRQRLQDSICAVSTASVALEQRPPLTLRADLADPS